MGNLNKTWLVLWGVVLSFFVYACSSSDFAGGAGKSAGLTGKDGKDSGKDGDDSADLNDGDGSGGKDSKGGKDEDGGGGKDEDGGLAGSDEDDSDDTGIGDPDGLDTVDGELSSKLRHDMTIERVGNDKGETDNPFTVKIEVIIKNKTASTHTVSFKEKELASKTLALACRTKKNTCLKVTVINDGKDRPGYTQVLGGDASLNPGETVCIWEHAKTQTSATIDVDANGHTSGNEFLGIGGGTCKEGEDDRFIISCPQSTKLESHLCTGE